MFRRRYLFAISVGVLLGLLSVATMAAGSSVVSPSSWTIPGFDNQRNFGSAPVLDLHRQSYLLRCFHVLIQEGFPKIALPVILCLGVAKLDELAEKNPAIGCFCRSGYITFGSVSLLAFLIVIATRIINLAPQQPLGLQLIGAWSLFWFWLSVTYVTGVAPVFWAFIFCLLWFAAPKLKIDNCSNPDPSPLVQAQAADELSLSENLMQDRQADEGELSGDVIHLPRQAVDAETGGNC